MDTRKLRHFIALTEYGSFRRAAEAVHLSQSALSRSIQVLEKELGVTLFDRTGSRTKITPAGRVLLGNARRLLFGTNELRREMARFQEGNVGCVTLAVSPTPASVFLAPYLADVQRQRPDLRLDIWIGRTSELIDAIRNEKYDVAIVDATAILDPKDLVIEHLASLVGGFFVRREHPLTMKSSCDINDIKTYSTICAPVSDEQVRRSADTFGPDGYPISLITYFCDSYDIQRNLAMCSDTVIIGIRAAVQADLDSGCLVQLNVNVPPLYGYYATVHLAGRSVSPAQTEFCQKAREIFSELAGLVVSS